MNLVCGLPQCSCTHMPTAAEAIARWVAAGDLNAWLNMYDAEVIALPPLPAALKTLQCYGCTALETLSPLPATLTHLYCGDCMALTALPPLPAALTCLQCRECTALATLPLLPATLTHLYFRGCTALAMLPPLPAALTYLQCYGFTALTALPPLPAGLQYLYCGDCTALETLPPLPASLTNLHCDTRYGARLEPRMRVALAVLAFHRRLRLPDAYPQGLRVNGMLHDASRADWRRSVFERHEDDRLRVAASLPPLALLYV
jgi:hypothetical protein